MTDMESSRRKLYEEVYAQGWFSHWKPNFFKQAKAHAISYRLKDVNLVLDIGSGDGSLLKAILDLAPSLEILGIDIASKAIHVAKKKMPKCEFLLASAERLPFRDGCFDSCYSSEVFEHIVNPDNMLQECFRVLKAIGKLVITTSNREVILQRRTEKDLYHLRKYNCKELMDILRDHAFNAKIIGFGRYRGYGRLFRLLCRLNAERIYWISVQFLGKLYPFTSHLLAYCSKCTKDDSPLTHQKQ